MRRSAFLGAVSLLATASETPEARPAAMIAASQAGEAYVVTPEQQATARQLDWQEFDQVGVLQGLHDCFDDDYRTAMSDSCR